MHKTAFSLVKDNFASLVAFGDRIGLKSYRVMYVKLGRSSLPLLSLTLRRWQNYLKEAVHPHYVILIHKYYSLLSFYQLSSVEV